MLIPHLHSGEPRKRLIIHYAEIVNYLIWYNCPTLILIIPKLDMI